MYRKCPECKALGRRRLWDESENAADGAFLAHPSGGASIARPLRRGFPGVSPDTPSSPRPDARQNPCRRSPFYYPDRHPDGRIEQAFQLGTLNCYGISPIPTCNLPNGLRPFHRHSCRLPH